MTKLVTERFREAVLRLHRAKDAAYGDAWKKRGEVMSILANLARKVDRIEHVLGGASVTPDESILDTAVDLLVYGLKYETFLADQDVRVAARLFDETGSAGAYSLGPTGFEVLLSRLDLTPLDQMEGLDTSRAARYVLTALADIEDCFRGTPPPTERRLELAQILTLASVTLLGALRRESPECYREFLFTYLNGTP